MLQLAHQVRVPNSRRRHHRHWQITSRRCRRNERDGCVDILSGRAATPTLLNEAVDTVFDIGVWGWHRGATGGAPGLSSADVRKELCTTSLVQLDAFVDVEQSWHFYK